MPRKTAVAAAEPPRRARKATTQSVQSAVEGVVVDDTDKVEFMGEHFLMAKSIGLMPLLRFAHASSEGLDSNDFEGLAAMYALIGDCIDQTVPMEEKPNPETGELESVPAGPSEWQRFQRHATAVKADAEDLMTLVQRVIERLAARPTKRPGGSPAGRPTTSANSKVSSLSQVMEGMTTVADLDRST